MSASRRFEVEAYIAGAPDRTPRFTEADLRVVADRAYQQGWNDGRVWSSGGSPSGETGASDV